MTLPPKLIPWALALGVAVLLEHQPAQAQKRRVSIVHTAPSKPDIAPAARNPSPETSLRSRLGFSVAARLLKSEHEDLRLQALERLGRVGTPQALELLGKALEPAGAARSSRERLTAVRALAPHVKAAAAKNLLGRVAVGVGAGGERSDELDSMVRDSAALALARSGQNEDLELLGKALRQPGRLSDSARAALLAYPPKDLGPLLKGRFAPTRELVRVLGELGDQRAFSPLREFVKRGSPEIRAEAAVSLTRLGSFETVELARHWLRSERQTALLEAAARILAVARAPEASAAISTLLASKETRAAGLALAFEAALPDLVPALAKALERSEADEERMILATLGRTAGSEAARELEQALSQPSRAPLAAYALALSPDDAAALVLARALRAPASRRDALRAAALRKVALSNNVEGVDQALEMLKTSRDAADRAAAAWAAAVLDPRRIDELIANPDPAVARAAARALLLGGEPKLAAERLLREKDPLTRTQLALALAFKRGSDRVPTSTLIELLDAGGPAAPLAAHALAARDSAALRPRIEALLASSDALLRSHAALGLGDSEDPSALGLLSLALRFEADRGVRRAIVIALSRRPEAPRKGPLTMAAELDPDPGVREAARLARSGVALDSLPLGVANAWLVAATTASPGDPLTPSAMLGPPGGLMLPAVADPDGRIVLSGLPSGPLTLRLAAAGGSGNAGNARKR